MFKKLVLLLTLVMLAGTLTCAAQPVIPAGLVDSDPTEAVLANYDEWYAAEAKPNEAKIVGKTIFSSPRGVVILRDAGKGTVIKSHFHAVTDEIVICLGGSAEMLINGEWKAVKAGDVHVNPRGSVHATRVLGGEDFKFISIFTPVTPAGGDTNFIKEGQPVSIPVGLLDSKPASAVLVNYNEWYAAEAQPNEPKISGKTIFSSPRTIVMVRDGGKGMIAKSHFHSTTDEIVVVMGGSGEILVNGEWTAVKAGDVHVNPRGVIHSTRVTGNEDLKFISIFNPVLPANGDANFLE